MDDDALILDSHPFRERHLVVSALTRSHGTVRGVLRGARGGRAPLTSATQVLSLVRLSAVLSVRAELATFRQVALLRSSYPLAATVERASAAAVVAELLATFCPPAEPAKLLFRLGVAVLDGLLAGADPDTAVAYAQLWVLHLGGVMPPLDRCAGCRAELARPRLGRDDGQARCVACAPAGSVELDAAALGWLEQARRLHLARVTDPPPAPVARWLDHLERQEAERPVRALDFYRRHGGG